MREGATVLELPAIVIEPPEDFAPFDAALRRLDSYQWVAFPSRNAVKSVFQRLKALNLDPGLVQNLNVGAVGPSTAAELGKQGIAVTCVPEEATGKALAASMARMGIQGSGVLLPAGNLSRPDLGDGLVAAGAIVERIIVYRTAAPTDVNRKVLEALRAGQLDLVALASPSAIRNLTEMLGPDRDVLRATPLACIGPSTAGAARELGLEPAVVASEHTLSGLAEAIIHTLTTERTHERS